MLSKTPACSHTGAWLREVVVEQRDYGEAMSINHLRDRFYPESRFGGFTDVDGTVAFYCRVAALLRPDSQVLNVGCGRGGALIEGPVEWKRQLLDLRGPDRHVLGIDIDPAASTNPGINDFHLLEASYAAWPVADASIDLIVADFVLEHIADPHHFFAEVSRVLKAGGVFCARTSNRVGYVGLLASLIPNRSHARVLSHAQPERATIDVFPTCYRANTVWALRRALNRAGLDGIAYGYEAEPSYLGFAAWAFALGKLVHALTPGPLRTCLFVFARKPGA